MTQKINRRTAGRPVADPDRDTRGLLLTAATELFAKHGIAATTFSTIARRAGVTPAMVHYHFRDRDALIDAVVDERVVPSIAEVWGSVQPDDQPAIVLSGVVERILTVIKRERWLPATWMREILNEGGLLRARVIPRIPRDKIFHLAQTIHHLQENNEINPDLNPILIVFSTIGLVMLHASTARAFAEIFNRPALSVDDMQRHITGLLLRGLSVVPLADLASPTTPDPNRRQS